MLLANVTRHTTRGPGPTVAVRMDVNSALRLYGLQLAVQIAYAADPGAFRAVYYEPRDARWFKDGLGSAARAWVEAEDTGRDGLTVHDPRVMADRGGLRWAATTPDGTRYTSDTLPWDTLKGIITDRDRSKDKEAVAAHKNPVAEARALTPQDDTELPLEE